MVPESHTFVALFVQDHVFSTFRGGKDRVLLLLMKSISKPPSMTEDV